MGIYYKIIVLDLFLNNVYSYYFQLVPVQYLLGFLMLFLSTKVDDYLDSAVSPNVKMLTIAFFMLNFLAATQDIAVDGWALTMLHRYHLIE